MQTAVLVGVGVMAAIDEPFRKGFLLNLNDNLILFAISGEIVEVNFLIKLVVWVFSIRILVIGLAKVQEFEYVLALLNLFLPDIILIVLGLLFV